MPVFRRRPVTPVHPPVIAETRMIDEVCAQLDAAVAKLHEVLDVVQESSQAREGVIAHAEDDRRSNGRAPKAGA